jgi:hypothetical protein
MLAAGLVVGLSACSDLKTAMGFEKQAPDEFQVVSRAPLAMPPDFSLRPPAPGTPRPQEGTTRDQARNAMLGQRQSAPISTVGRDEGDVKLLRRAGVDQAQPGIRALIDKETQALADADRTLADKIVFWRKQQGPGLNEQLDATKEAQRLRENQALGKAITEGDTPRIERRRRGMLEGIF